MDVVWIFLVLAVTVEALVEYGKTLVAHDSAQQVGLQLAAIAVAVGLCVAAQVDVYAALGISFGGLPVVGSVLTGVFASRGANYASDLLGRLQSETKR